MTTDKGYQLIFDPSAPEPARLEALQMQPRADAAEPHTYQYTDSIVLAVNVALVTGRPLLLRGAPGSGKSTLAASVAWRLGCRYYSEVITSRTQARDLLWRYDQVRRLNDAQVGRLQQDAAYVEPGVLWWAFDPASASHRGAPEGTVSPMKDPSPEAKHTLAVVLLDEIDKADPDVPNDLLVPLGAREFTVGETGTEVKSHHPLLVVITTNDERELPAAFQRRCVMLELPEPDEKQLVHIAQAHFGSREDALYADLAGRVMSMRQEARARRERGPSTPEYLDALRAARSLELESQPADALWQQLVEMTLRKRSV
jgi:MoxR-like ATPase